MQWDRPTYDGRAFYARIIRAMALALPLIAGTSAALAQTVCPDQGNSVDLVLSDMKLPSEEFPHGLKLVTVARNGRSYPTYAARPRLSYGNGPPARWNAIQGWGQVYEGVGGNAARHTLVELRNFRTYMFDKTLGQWRLLQASAGVNGRSFAEDWRSSPPQPGDTQASAEGSTKVRVAPGRNFHFWPQVPRPEFDRATLGGLFTTAQARLVTDDSGIDDRPKADYVMSVGADYWATNHSAYDNLKTNGDAGIGRFKKLSACWQTFNMTTIKPAAFSANPPPLK